MNKLKRIQFNGSLILTFTLIFGLYNLAIADNYVCPGSYTTVITGYSMAQVEAACGKPKSITKKQVKSNTPATYIQWIYTPPNISANEITESTPQLIISFDKNQVQQISTTNQLVGNQFSCYRNKQFHIGSSLDDVRAACGNPSLVKTMQQANSQTIEIQQWTYEFGRYQPAIIFTFEAGKLKSIHMGQVAK